VQDNFERAYTTNRAPFVITLDADFLTVLPENGGVRALERFLVEVRAQARVFVTSQTLAKPDVHVVTAYQAVQWLRDPTPTERLASFAPWTQCAQRNPSMVSPCQVCCRRGEARPCRAGAVAATTRS